MAGSAPSLRQPATTDVTVAPLPGLRRAGRNAFVGFLMKKAKPDKWNEATLLMRFVNAAGDSTMFQFTQEAFTVMDVLEEGRVYNIEVPGTCVKAVAGLTKYGIPTLVEVRATRSLPFSIAQQGFLPRAKYRFLDWEAITQQQDGSFVDFAGIVHGPPRFNYNTQIKKLLVELANGDMKQIVTCLGDHADSEFKEGDKVVFGSLKLNKWKEQRTLETTVFTMTETNPSPREGLEFLANMSKVESPRRKVLKLNFPARCTVQQAHQLTANLLAKAPTENTEEFSIEARFTQFDESFFESDPPLYGNEGAERMGWKTSMVDASGTISLKVWDEPCYTVWQITAAKFRERFEAGVLQETQRTRILEELNEPLEKVYRCACKAKVWTSGSDHKPIHTVQIDVNMLEPVEA